MIKTPEHPLNQEYHFLELSIPIEAPNVTIVALNRPKKLNAIHSPMCKEIGDVFSRLGTLGDDCRCVLLTGNGRGFCAGIDLQDLSFMESSEDGLDDPARKGLAMVGKIQQMQDCFSQLEKCPVPVVCALHGVVVGAGMDLACCTDIRVAAKNTIFSVREVKVGMVADVGTLQRLPKMIGNCSLANEICLTGRNFSVKEAVALGFVSCIAHPESIILQEAMRICQAIASNSPIAVVGTKKALLYARDHTVADSLQQVISYNSLALQSEDLFKAIDGAMQKQLAKFHTIPRHSKL